MSAPLPLEALPAGRVLGLLTDIDDTLTTEGRLHADAYEALWSLRRAGLAVVPVTGRSAGWAHLILKTWPVDAVVAESGGLYLAREAQGRLRTVFHDTPERVAQGRRRLMDCADRVMAAVPGLAPASDNAFRLVDLALDWCEEVPRLPEAAVQEAIARFQAEGFSARASSVHVNAWQGSFDKAPMALRCIAEGWAGSPLADPQAWAFIGDAPNDASMFAAFELSVGVANLLPAIDRLPTPPRYLASEACGAGFVAFARHLLADRSRPA